MSDTPSIDQPSPSAPDERSGQSSTPDLNPRAEPFAETEPGADAPAGDPNPNAEPFDQVDAPDAGSEPAAPGQA